MSIAYAREIHNFTFFQNKLIRDILYTRCYTHTLHVYSHTYILTIYTHAYFMYMKTDPVIAVGRNWCVTLDAKNSVD